MLLLTFCGVGETNCDDLMLLRESTLRARLGWTVAPRVCL